MKLYVYVAALGFGLGQSRLSPAAIDQITTAAIPVVLPSDGALSGMPIARRAIRFDRDRTLIAFGHTDRVARLQEMLGDCNAFGTKPCARLGDSVYVWMQPVSIKPSEALVRVVVSWADRSTRSAYLASFAAELYFAPTAKGEWKFVRRGVTAASN